MKRIHVYTFWMLGFIVPNLYAQTQVIDLNVGYKQVHFADKTVTAIAVNDQIPGPTLHFHEGDEVLIRVHNHLKLGTTIHWHGVLVPWRMDGVEHVTQEPIAPGGEFDYHFKIKQSGTYWYHAHADLQEQQGLYGAIIIEPNTPSPYHYDKDFPVVISDWTNENPANVYKHLKQNGDYYSQLLPLQPSLQQFFKDMSAKDNTSVLKNYWDMQVMRMNVYDLSDVKYDAFLLNGSTTSAPWQQTVKVGDTIRLRFVGAGASSLFKIKVSDAPLTVVHVQGNDIKPFVVNHINLAPGQTIDVLVTIKENKPYYIYAESIDTSGYALGVLNPTVNKITAIPAITPFPVPHPMGMPAMSSNNMSGMKMANDSMPMQDNHDDSASWQALTPTNDPNKPVTVITMRLGGYMDRYMWFINGLPEYLAKPIVVQPGQRYRLVFINETMMHHPMHLHGHWLILRNGHGAYDPLVHTIDVGPFQTVTADFDTDAGSGWWYLHCHNLYHMKAGMARVVHYDVPDDGKSSDDMTDAVDPTAVKTAHPAGKYLLNDWQYGHDFARDIDQFTIKTMFGGDYNKLEILTNQAQVTQGTVTNADVDIFAWHLLNNFWAIKGGANYVYRPSAYWQPGAGLEGVLPFFIDTDIRSYWHDGSGKLDVELSRNTELTSNWSFLMDIRTIAASKSLEYAQIGQGLNSIEYTIGPSYQLSADLTLQLQYQYTRYYGDTVDLVNAATANQLTFGLEMVF